ncbi:MAG: tetratricopeptide repeat protein [Marinobacter sp.]|uniref:tetratricopeptide repeat protein n=1 Tax=Marinobacter sp. TaxID=50741 RepID=UPI003F9845FD
MCNLKPCWHWCLLATVLCLFGCSGQTIKPSLPVEQSQKPPDPQQALVHVQEGAAAYEQNNLPAAIEAWQLAVELNPADAVTHNNLALLLQQAHRFKEAAGVLETGLEGSPNVAELHYNLAVISELYLLDLNRALTHYQRYQGLSDREDKKVEGWIADLERRLD